MEQLIVKGKGMFKRIKHSLSQQTNKPILLVGSDGFVLHAVVVHAESGKIKVEAWAKSQTSDQSAAVAEICNQLREKLGHVPNKAHMLVPGLISALIELPVEPDKPRPDVQMQELIRWEIDPFVSEYDDLWNIGAILQGSDYLTAEQRSEISTELEQRLAEGDTSLQRFGELALSRHFITREQLEECLMVQENLVSREVNLTCGWSVQQWGAQEDLQYTWLVGAITAHRRKQWFSSFSNEGVRLQQIYSRFGAVISLLATQNNTSGEHLLLEMHQEQMACFRVVNGKTIVSLQIIPRPLVTEELSAACITLCGEQLRSDIDIIWLHSALPLPNELIPALSAGLERDVKQLTPNVLAPKALTESASEYLSLYGLAQSLLKINKNFYPLAIPATDPPPPLWKNFELLRFIIPVIFCIGLVGHLVWSKIQLGNIQQDKVQINIEKPEKNKLNSIISQMAGEASRYTTEINSKKKKLHGVNKKLTLIENELINRKTKIPLFLRTLATAINPYVVIDQLVEVSAPPGFQLTVWAVQDASAQKFAKQLESSMAKLGYMVADIELKSARGRTGVSGYGVNIWLVPVTAQKANTQKNNNTKGAPS